MAIDVIMPKAGMDMQEGQIFKWHKKVGDYVQKGEVLLEIVTDKVNMEVEAEESGYLLKILKEEGEIVPVITTIAYLGERGEKVQEIESTDKNNAPLFETEKMDEVYHENEQNLQEEVKKNDEFAIRATPKARKYARENDVDLSNVTGTQENGRICYHDVMEYDKKRISISPVARSYANYEGIEIPENFVGSGVNKKVMKSDLLGWKEKSSDGLLKDPKEKVDFIGEFVESAVNASVERTCIQRTTKVQKMNNMRTVICKRMKESYLTSPVVHYNISVNMKNVEEFIKKNRELLKENYDVNVNINDFIMLALSRTLLKHPVLNCRIDEENAQIIYYEYVDLAMAVGLDEGLLTPVIRNAQTMSLLQMAISSRQMSKKARDGRLTAKEISDSTFTISNLGMYEIESFTPIINQPNTAILGVGAMIKTPFVNNENEIETAPFIKFSLSADHRVCDGVVAAKFMRDFKNALENPVLLLV